jgi:hypothetical protein
MLTQHPPRPCLPPAVAAPWVEGRPRRRRPRSVQRGTGRGPFVRDSRLPLGDRRTRATAIIPISPLRASIGPRSIPTRGVTPRAGRRGATRRPPWKTRTWTAPGAAMFMGSRVDHALTSYYRAHPRSRRPADRRPGRVRLPRLPAARARPERDKRGVVWDDLDETGAFGSASTRST